MLDLGVVPHILTLLEQHVDQGDVSVQHAGLSALRNLAIPGTDEITKTLEIWFKLQPVIASSFFFLTYIEIYLFKDSHAIHHNRLQSVKSPK